MGHSVFLNANNARADHDSAPTDAGEMTAAPAHRATIHNRRLQRCLQCGSLRPSRLRDASGEPHPAAGVTATLVRLFA
jgi:hypothetical protein